MEIFFAIFLALLAGMILSCFLIPLFSPRHAPFFLVAASALMVIGGAWGYYRQFDKPDDKFDPFACAETNGKTICTFKGKPFKPQGFQEYVCEKVDGNMLCERSKGTVIQHKGKTYTLHHLDGNRDVYVAE